MDIFQALLVYLSFIFFFFFNAIKGEEKGDPPAQLGL